jgi:hypothetical protein
LLKWWGHLVWDSITGVLLYYSTLLQRLYTVVMIKRSVSPYHASAPCILYSYLLTISHNSDSYNSVGKVTTLYGFSKASFNTFPRNLSSFAFLLYGNYLPYVRSSHPPWRWQSSGI